MVFLNGNVAFQVLMGMLLKVPFDILGSSPVFGPIRNPGSANLQIQGLVFPFAGNTIPISTWKIASSRNRIKWSFSPGGSVSFFYIQMPLTSTRSLVCLFSFKPQESLGGGWNKKIIIKKKPGRFPCASSSSPD